MTAQAVARQSYSVIIALDRRTMNRFSRKELETFARIQFCRELPAGLVLPKDAEFTYAVAENRMTSTPWTHVMRVQADVTRSPR